MIAVLQADSSSSYPILLLQKSGEGHGIGNSFQQTVDATTERYAFFWSNCRRHPEPVEGRRPDRTAPHHPRR